MRFALSVALAAVACASHERVASVYVAPTPLPSATPVTIVRTPEKTHVWPDEETARSRDGSFRLRYPSSTFKASAPGNSISLTSEISEPGMGGGNITFRVLLTKLDVAPVAEIAKIIDADSFNRAFPPNGTFHASEGFIDEYRGANGARGYLVQMGVEGTGENVYVATTNDGASWRFECQYCCGMIEKPKMTADAQRALCETLITTFERDRP